MKRALIILLILGVAGGLFAQVTWTGSVGTGIGLLKTDDADDAVFGLVDKADWENGIQANLNFSYLNDDGDAGFEARFRATGDPDGFSAKFFPHYAYGWASTCMFKLVGGKVHATEIDGNDFYGETWWNSLSHGYGLIAYVNPLDMLKIGFGAKSDAVLPAGRPWDEDGVALWLGVGVDAGIVDARVNFQISKNDISGMVTAAIPLGIVDIGLGAWFWQLNEFSDLGQLKITGNVGLNLMDNLGLTVKGMYDMHSAFDDPFIGFGLEADYAIGSVKPLIAVGYFTGQPYKFWGLNYGANWYGYYDSGDNVPYSKDLTYLTINPGVEFSIGPSKLEFGAVINMDMGDANAAGSSDKGMSYAVYLGYSFSF